MLRRINISRHPRMLVLIGLVLFFSLTALTVPTLRPWVDEAWASAPVWSLITRGYSGTPSFDGSAFGPNGLQGLDRICYWEPPLYLAIQSLWFRVMPFNLESLRILSVLAGLGGLICWYVIMKRLTGNIAAASLLLLIMSCDYIADTAASFGRADAMSFAFQSAAYASFLSLREKRVGLAILVSQTFVVASGLTHPNGGVLAFLGQAFLTIYFDRTRLRLKHLLLAASPYAIGGIAWGAYILKDPSAFVAQYSYQTSLRFFRALNPLSAIQHEAQRYIMSMGLAPHTSKLHSLKAVVFVAYLVGLVGVLTTRRLRQTMAARSLLGITAIYLFYFTFLEGTKASYYFIYLVYVYSALLALWLSWCWRERTVPRSLLALAVLGIVVVQSGGLVMRARNNDYHNGYTAAVIFIRDHASPTDLVVGSHELGFALGFQERFLDDYRLGVVSGNSPDYIVIEEVYQDRFEMLRSQRPGDYIKVRDLLNHYREVYNHNSYRILTRKGG